MNRFSQVITFAAALLFSVYTIGGAVAGEEYKMTPAEVSRIQEVFLEMGQTVVGLPDGVFGPNLKAAISNWQSRSGQKVTGYLDKKMFDVMYNADQSRINIVWNAISASNDGVYHVVRNMPKGLGAFREAHDGCVAKSKFPKNCLVAGASVKWSVVVLLCKKETADTVYTMNASGTESTHKGALDNAYSAASEKGFLGSACRTLVEIVGSNG
jgi:peptidoglycan hydrolase-like protein with peptidoglycan-binding domain